MRSDSSQQTLQQLINSPAIKRRFDELLDKTSASFMSSILTIVNTNSKLKECDNNSILHAAGVAAALKLPINPSLGFAYIVPYGKQAQFQIGWKGLVQLAMRSGQYRTLNSGLVCEGQIEDIDFITGEIVRGKKISNKPVGYVAYMELLNGFNKSLYMTKEEVDIHAQTYSQSYIYDLRSGRKSSVWSTNFDAMAKKTVLKLLLSRFGVMSIDQKSADLAKALQADQAVVTENGLRYVDNEPDGEENIVPFEDVLKSDKADNADTQLDQEGDDDADD